MASSMTGTFLYSPLATSRTGWPGTASNSASWRVTRSACAEDVVLIVTAAWRRWMVRIWTGGSTGFGFVIGLWADRWLPVIFSPALLSRTTSRSLIVREGITIDRRNNGRTAIDTSRVPAFAKSNDSGSRCSAMETCLRIIVGVGNSFQVTGPPMVTFLCIPVLIFSVTVPECLLRHPESHSSPPATSKMKVHRVPQNAAFADNDLIDVKSSVTEGRPRSGTTDGLFRVWAQSGSSFGPGRWLVLEWLLERSIAKFDVPFRRIFQVGHHRRTPDTILLSLVQSGP